MPEEKSTLTLERVRQISDSLRERTAIERVFVFLDGDDLTEFVRRAVVAEWILNGLPKAKALAAFRAGCGGREAVFSCAPSLAASLVAENGAPAVIPVDWFDIGVRAPIQCQDPGWQRDEMSKPDLVLLPGMLSAAPCLIDGLAEHPPRFRLPEHFAAGDPTPNGWTACIDAALEEALGSRIEGDLGGTVIPLAAPESGGDGEITRLVAAIARARFVISASPLPLCLASAFRVPCAGIGPIRVEDCLWNRGDIVLADAGIETLLKAVDRLAATSRKKEPARVPNDTVSLPLTTRSGHLLDVWN